MNEQDEMVLAEHLNLVKPAEKDKLAVLIRQKTALNIKSKAEKIIARTKADLRATFALLCDSLFCLTEEDLKKLSDSQLVELETEIDRRYRKNRGRKLIGGSLTIFGISAMFAGITFPPFWTMFMGLCGLSFFVVGMHILLGARQGEQKNYYLVYYAQKRAALKKEAEQKFNAELLDALRTPQK